MEIKFHTEERKKLARKIAELMGEQARYLGVPSCAYQIGEFMLSKDSVLSVPDDYEDIGGVLEELAQAGYESEVSLTIEVPKEKVNLRNLRNLLEAKGALIQKALGAEDLPVIEKEKTVVFPWFHHVDPNEVKAYRHFVLALCEMTVNTRISSKEKPIDNEKYTFRCFLLRLGFIGKEYKQERKILLKNLKGSSAFRDGKRDIPSE